MREMNTHPLIGNCLPKLGPSPATLSLAIRKVGVRLID
jgi:hypothetical protein